MYFFYFLFIPFLIILFIISYYFLLFPYYFLIISVQNLLPFEICASTISWFILSHYQIPRLITKFSIYSYLSTYKIYIKIRGEDLVPCRGEGSPIPLISRRESGEGPARSFHTHSRGVLRGVLPIPLLITLPRPIASLIISRRESGEVLLFLS